MENNLEIIELSQYIKPKITEDKNDNWVSIGENNDFFKYLIDLYTDSPTNHSIINGITAQIYGKGLNCYEKETKPDEHAALLALFSKKDLKKAILDLKIMGMAALQVSYAGKKVKKVGHFPMQCLRPEKINPKSDGKIKAWYYAPDWSKIKNTDKPLKIPVFGSGAKNEIYIIQKYTPGKSYISYPEHFGSAAYCELESNISDYLLNTVNNSFSSSKMISFNGGIPDREKMIDIKNEVINKLTGQYGEKLLVSFNQSKETAPEIIDLPVQDAAATYQYLSEECSRKIMIGHRVTSPLLIGLRDGNSGLGSNADEIVNSSRLFENVTIKPYRDIMTDAIEEILAANKISLEVYFETLEPLEFRDNTLVTEENLNNKLDSLKLKKQQMSLELENKIIDNLKGEDISDDYELLEEQDAISLEEELQAQKNIELLEKSATKLFAFNPKTKDKSKFDKGLYILRYKYDGNKDPERKFCQTMMNRNKGKKYGSLYRYEDIVKLSESSPNPGLGLSGSDTYDLFLYAGGNNCKHRWRRMVFFRKRQDGKFLPKSKTAEFENDKKVANTPFEQPKNSGKAQKTPSSRGIGNKK